PLLGQVMVAGKSAAQAERYMRDLLEKDYLVHPHVIITVKEFKNEQVSVQGYVNIPKLITLPPDQPMTILQAISEAGGLQRIGNPNKIELIRQGEPNRVFKLNDLKSVADPSQIIYLKPNDVVYVSERGLF
ncbi:MAG: SLBB domain-containing protein, partial [Verrucomicrobia bacterium]|nr:SLBB domain-containing protein [Verrucomicrobiota bacterium]